MEQAAGPHPGPAGEGQGPSLPWLGLGAATLFGAFTLASLCWLLWAYVPLHATLFDLLGLAPTRATVVAVASSNWFVGQLPFLVTLAVVVGPFGMPLVLKRLRVAGQRAVKALTAVALILGILAAGGCTFLLYAVNEAYTAAVADKRLGESLRECGAYQREKQLAPRER